MTATLGCGLALLGVFGGCGPASGTCSPDNHTVLDSTGKVIATCLPTEACSTTGCAVCDPTVCKKNNKCVLGSVNFDDVLKGTTTNQTTECRLTCAAPEDCPFDYHCVSAAGGGGGYCAKDRGAFTPKTAGEAAGGAPWGTPCDPTKGIGSNSDCDQTQQFWCYGASPTDGNAFCTQYQCNDDGDCPGGWWCADLNDSPNVTTSKRNDWGTTNKLCLPRAHTLKPGSYCAPCKSDLDCPLNDGTKQHCTPADAASSTELTCAVECTGNSNCPLDYACKDPGTGTMVCVPRAGTCMGDGSFCAPCHSDDDCSKNGGFCVPGGDYSNPSEHFCTAPTPTCSFSSTTGFTDTCPALPANTKAPNTTTDGVGCSYAQSGGIPLKQCYGGNSLGNGCWTYHCQAANGSCAKGSDCCSNICNANACN